MANYSTVNTGLNAILEDFARGAGFADLARAAGEISERYRSGGADKRITCETEALAYALTRMPATAGAIHSALSRSLECVKFGGAADSDPAGYSAATLLDAGAGTGAAVWAAAALMPHLSRAVCVEREDHMLRLGKMIFERGKTLGNLPAAIAADWICGDFTTNSPQTKPHILSRRADLVIASYSLGELDPEIRRETVDALWEASGKMLLVVEPGTPGGSAVIGGIRAQLSGRAAIAAPCPGAGKPDGEPIGSTCSEWCHFSQRISRGSLHRRLKNGGAPYEDEKFSYAAFVREPAEVTAVNARVIRHPYHGSGFVKLQICGEDGTGGITLSKRDGEIYRPARKIGWGDGYSGW